MKQRMPIPGRARLAEQKPNRVLAFANTPIGLWILSTIFIGLGSWAYTQWHDARVKREEIEKKIEKMDVEINFRLTTYPTYIAHDPYAPPQVRGGGPRRISINTVPSPEFQVYPEFGSRSMTSLLEELQTLVDDRHERECIEIAETFVNLLEGTIIASRSPPSEFSTVIVLDYVRKLRWGVDLRPELGTQAEMIKAFIEAEFKAEHLASDAHSDQVIEEIGGLTGVSDTAIASCAQSARLHSKEWTPQDIENVRRLRRIHEEQLR